MMKHALKAGVAVVFCATAFACGDDSGANTGGTGAVGGVAGMTGGTGGVTGGTGGMTGGMMGGTGGMTGGMGGAAGMMGGMGGTEPTGDPKWSAIFSEIIMAKGCNQGGQCHGGPSGGLMMSDKDSTYAALVGVDAMGMLQGFPNCSESGLKRVVPMDPDNSLLLQKIEGMPDCGVQMPPAGLLPQEQRDQVRMWIVNGALND